MTEQQEKPKEFWIDPVCIGKSFGGSKLYHCSEHDNYQNSLRLIEYSAYKSQRAELKKALDLIEELKKEIECGSQKI